LSRVGSSPRRVLGSEARGVRALSSCVAERRAPCDRTSGARGQLLCVVTQNIDGLHLQAGTSRARLVEVHGTDRLVECLTCFETSYPVQYLEGFKATRQPPLCACGGFLKPATISFGQPLRPADLERAAGAARKADLVLALGSTLSVYPAAS